MASEIERKFLVTSDAWKQEVKRQAHYRQGYLCPVDTSSVRVRVADEAAWLNVKSATLGIERLEYEYSIPLGDANEMLDRLCKRPLIEKTRYWVEYADHTWEIDVFEGDNEGLVVAEIELDRPDETFELPSWAGAEVSHDPRYYNVCLVDHPYKEWSDRKR